MARYPKLFSPWSIRNCRIKNRVVFPPTCPTWVSDPWNGLFIDMATAYYEERAKGGVGLIIIGGTHVHPSSIMAPLMMPQLFDEKVGSGPAAGEITRVRKAGFNVSNGTLTVSPGRTSTLPLEAVRDGRASRQSTRPSSSQSAIAADANGMPAPYSAS